eukprot:3240768-Amphidinium_carterae.1
MRCENVFSREGALAFSSKFVGWLCAKKEVCNLSTWVWAGEDQGNLLGLRVPSSLGNALAEPVENGPRGTNVAASHMLLTVQVRRWLRLAGQAMLEEPHLPSELLLLDP